MLKIIHTMGLPISMPLDPTAEFQPGMFAQLKIIGNDIIAGISDGTAPYGIIDDARTNAFTRTQIDEVVEVDVPQIEINDNGERVNLSEVVAFLDNPSLVHNSFTSTISVALNEVNGAIIIPAGTPLNFDFDDDGILDGFRIIVNYVYRIPNKSGDDTTLGSGKITVHYTRGIYATDQFDSKQTYPLNASLYVGLDGKLTSKQPTDNHPGIAMVTGPPSATAATLEFILF